MKKKEEKKWIVLWTVDSSVSLFLKKCIVCPPSCWLASFDCCLCLCMWFEEDGCIGPYCCLGNASPHQKLSSWVGEVKIVSLSCEHSKIISGMARTWKIGNESCASMAVPGMDFYQIKALYYELWIRLCFVCVIRREMYWRVRVHVDCVIRLVSLSVCEIIGDRECIGSIVVCTYIWTSLNSK